MNWNDRLSDQELGRSGGVGGSRTLLSCKGKVSGDRTGSLLFSKHALYTGFVGESDFVLIALNALKIGAGDTYNTLTMKYLILNWTFTNKKE